MNLKQLLMFIIFIAVLLGCDSTKAVVVFGSIDVTSNGIIASDFPSGKIIELDAVVSENFGDYTLYWKVDNGEYVASTEHTKSFGPYEDLSVHTVSIKAVSTAGGAEIEKVITLNIGSPVSRNGRLSLSGTNIINENGKAIQLRGMSTHGIQYFTEFYTENAIKALAEDWHADIIRISSYVNEGWSKGTYLQEPEYWRARIDTLVDWAETYGIYALIDWHQLVPGNPNAYLQEAKEFFEYMVDKHGDKPNVLFDICNEPNNDSIRVWDEETKTSTVYKYSKSVTWSDIKSYAEEILPIIRKKSNNLVIIGTPQWASRPDLVVGSKLEYENVLYAMHFYAADHKDYITYVEQAIAGDVPVFVTEFGTQSADGDQKNDFVSSRNWLNVLKKHKISWINWNYSNDFRSGAVFLEEFRPSNVESYSNLANLKEAGQWILQELNYPADDF